MSCACTFLPFSLVAAFNFVTVLLRCMLSSLFLCLYRFQWSSLLACSLFPRMSLAVSTHLIRRFSCLNRLQPLQFLRRLCHCYQNNFEMSMVPGCSADVHFDDITSITAAGSLPSVTFVDLTLPDSPDSPVQLSSPVPHGRIVRPGEQGSLAPLPKRAVLAGLQQTAPTDIQTISGVGTRHYSANPGSSGTTNQFG
ncbi:unnamed protein product [Clavelina lepadiformis]|uniref:Uncharacterized protein n=1 Tax=Clavelina lepadiformis TaxID=159417 RepID=A0ABP0G2D0_CLALP